MSIEAINWVWKHSHAKPTARIVLLSLADRAGSDHGDCWPSIKDIAQRTGLSPRQVQRQIRALCSLGEIAIEERTGPHGTNRYRLTMGVTPVSGVTDMTGVTSKAPGVTSKAKRGDTSDTRTIIEPTIEPMEVADFEDFKVRSESGVVIMDEETLFIMTADPATLSLENQRRQLRGW